MPRHIVIRDSTLIPLVGDGPDRINMIVDEFVQKIGAAVMEGMASLMGQRREVIPEPQPDDTSAALVLADGVRPRRRQPACPDDQT